VKVIGGGEGGENSQPRWNTENTCRKTLHEGREKHPLLERGEKRGIDKPWIVVSCRIAVEQDSSTGNDLIMRSPQKSRQRCRDVLQDE